MVSSNNRKKASRAYLDLSKEINAKNVNVIRKDKKNYQNNERATMMVSDSGPF